MPFQFLSIKQVCELSGLSKSSIYRYAKTGNFPQPVQLGPRRVAWKPGAIEAWMNNLTPTS